MAGSVLHQPFGVVGPVDARLHQQFDIVDVPVVGGDPVVGANYVPPIWLPLMVFDKAGAYLGSIAAFNVTGPPVRYLRSRQVTSEGTMTFTIPRGSPDAALVQSDRLVLLQSRNREAPWAGTMAPQASGGGVIEVQCLDPWTLIRDGPPIVFKEEVSDGTPATALVARVMAMHNDARAATGDYRWALDLGGSRPFRGDADFDADTLSILDVIINRSRIELAWTAAVQGGQLILTLVASDGFTASGAAIFDGPGGNVVAGVQAVEDPSGIVTSIRVTGETTDLAACLPEWAQWALLDVTPEVTVSVDPGAYRARQAAEETLDWGLSKAAVAAQCNAIQDWIWGLYRSFLMAVHDIEGRPWHDGWAYLGPPDIYEPKAAGRDSLSRRAWKTRLQLVEVLPNEPASAVMLSDKHCRLDLRSWLIVKYNRVTGVQTVTTVALPTAAGLSLVQWHTNGVVMIFRVSGGRIVARTSLGAGTGAYVDPYNVRVWDPVDRRYRNLRRIISGGYALAWYINPGDADNQLTDLGPEAAVDQAAGDGSSFIGKVYDFELLRIDDYDPRRDGIGALKSAPTIFNGAVTTRARWHIVSFATGADASTALTEGISAGDTAFLVDSIFGFPDPVIDAAQFPFQIAIGDGADEEIVTVLSMEGALWTVLRGQGGTTSIIHEAGTPVKRSGSVSWPGFPFPYMWPEGEQWALDELALRSKPRIDLDVHVAHHADDQLTVTWGSSHAVNVATEGRAGRWVGTGRAIGWSTGDGETEVVLEWQ